MAHAARNRMLALPLACALLVLLPGAAPGAAFTPPDGKSFHGVSETGNTADYRAFADQTNAHSAISQSFFHWGVPLGTGALQRWRQTRTRGVLSLSTAPGGQPELIDPKAIAKGRGDKYMLSLNDSIADSRQVVYIRLFPEMNGHWNPYSAYNADGSSRGADHSTKQFKRAWKRFAIVVRGGALKTINAKLRRLRMPRLLRARSNRDKVYRRNGVGRRLPKPKVALMWVPQTVGSPNRPGNAPQRYWPGNRYVDWVGADAYAKYSNSTLWNRLNGFYRRFDGKPFVIGEYGPWDGDPGGAFTDRIFDWVRTHRRARMLIYYRSVNPTNVFNIGFYPDALGVLRDKLNGAEFMPLPPEYTP
jgi:hypothetical protein